jgi:Membrane carboxypeptidase (penicillin-binding protein)
MIGYTPDVVVASWIGFDKTDQNHFIPGTSENGLAPLFKNEMENILPETKGTDFGVKDAANLAKASKDNSGNKDITKSIEDGVNNVKIKPRNGIMILRTFLVNRRTV